MRKHLKEKDERLNKSEQKILELENHIMIFKQQLNKQKAEVTSLNQFNSYL